MNVGFQAFEGPDGCLPQRQMSDVGRVEASRKDDAPIGNNGTGHGPDPDRRPFFVVEREKQDGVFSAVDHAACGFFDYRFQALGFSRDCECVRVRVRVGADHGVHLQAREIGGPAPLLRDPIPGPRFVFLIGTLARVGRQLGGSQNEVAQHQFLVKARARFLHGNAQGQNPAVGVHGHHRSPAEIGASAFMSCRIAHQDRGAADPERPGHGAEVVVERCQLLRLLQGGLRGEARGLDSAIRKRPPLRGLVGDPTGTQKRVTVVGGPAFQQECRGPRGRGQGRDRRRAAARQVNADFVGFALALVVAVFVARDQLLGVAPERVDGVGFFTVVLRGRFLRFGSIRGCPGEIGRDGS
mmetsp:Transcript_22976/g.63735  ORF Transcript_22976/g.63735 Transcript_22976/m.63735 type:complete len:354 (+) Transcript_22976:903-1964(+)